MAGLRTGAQGCGNRRGFTLIEVLITLVILSTGIVIVLEAFQTSLVALNAAREHLRATSLLEQKTSEIGLEVLAGTRGGGRMSEIIEQEPFRGFRCDSSVSRVDGQGAGVSEAGIGLYEIRATISKAGSSAEVTGVTRIARPEP